MSGTTNTGIGLELLGSNGVTSASQLGAFVLTADEIATVAVTPTTGQTPENDGAFSASQPTNWATASGETWLQGGTSNTLTYTMVAASDPNQVVTFQITDQNNNLVDTIYGQVISWNSGFILFQGFQAYNASTGVLSEPLAASGGSPYFMISTSTIASNTAFGLLQPGSTTPFGLDTTGVPVEPSAAVEYWNALNFAGSPAVPATGAPAVPGVTGLGTGGGAITLSAANFATVSATSTLDPGTLPSASYDVSANSTWQDDTNSASQFWLQGGSGTDLTYTMTAGNNADQVVTFTITNGSGATVGVIYGQALAWTDNGILFDGYRSFDASTNTLSDPMSGTGAPSFFVVSSASLEGATGQLASDSFTNSGLALPFGLSEITVQDVPAVQLAEQVSCFAAGTSIQTPAGPAAVEDLVAGDLVLTASGVARPVQWIGRSHLRCDRHPNPGRVMPVRIEAGAFGPNLPARDLLLSPEHAIYHDGVMIPAHCLVNGATIRQMPAKAVAYYHVELPRHDVLLAEGLPTESYLDTGTRQAMTLSDAQTQSVA